MKTIKIKQCFFISLMLVMAVSCQNIVNYNDGWNFDETSNGAPEISNITPVEKSDSVITAGALAQLISINGKNLTGLKSISFNDVAVDLKTAYIKASHIVLPIPRVLPGNITNKLEITTEQGKVSYDFVVNIPDLVISGLYNEYTLPGDTAEIVGDFFDLYKLTPQDGKVYFGNQELPIISATDKSIFFKVPQGASNNQQIKLSSTYAKLTTPVNVSGMYRESGFKLIDFDNASSYNGIWSGANLITSGTNAGDPKPLNGKFTRFQGSFGAWSWNTFFGGGVTVDLQDLIDNKSKYTLKFEINTNTKYPLNVGNLAFQVFGGWYTWNPAVGIAFNTYGKWKTVSFDIVKLGAAPVAGWNNIALTYQPTEALSIDVSFANFRIVNK
jgi:hypothetical protein